MTRRAARRRARVDAAVAVYRQWHSERDAVRAAYRVWVAASACAEPSAFETYQSALDREERAAKARRAPDRDRSRASAGVDAGSSGGVVER
jgi:hypothetical protein